MKGKTVLGCLLRVQGCALAAALLLAGCATTAAQDPRDPFESYNRAMNDFNDTIDRALLKPVATVYQDHAPKRVQSGVRNFFGNLSDVVSFGNNILQGKPEGALHSFWRVAVNTTIGLGGLLDPATEMHLVRHREDFGQTLGRWGFGPGPYLVLPFFGPSTVRDGIALPVDLYSHPLAHVHDVPVRNSLIALRVLDTRAGLLATERLLDSAALDPYAFTRDAYLQKRLNDVYDGNPPLGPEERYDLQQDGP